MSQAAPQPALSSSERAAEYREHLRRRIRRMYPLALVLFLTTCWTTWDVGGTEYAVAVMSILLAHEMGHFLQSLRYHVPASPPLFIPMPLALTGTMGAVIVQAGGFANRRAMFDIAVSGPLAGLVLAIPACWWGLDNARVSVVDPDVRAVLFGDPLLLQWMYDWKFGGLAPNEQVELTPLLFAGWVGVFITALNLLPVGQLDGGHILYTLIGRRAHAVAISLAVFAGGWMMFHQDWSYVPFLILLMMFGLRHPPTADDTVPLGPFRIVLGWLTLAFLVIGFIPRPIMTQEGAPPAAPVPAAEVFQAAI